MPRGGARPGAGRKPKVRPPGEETPGSKTKPAATKPPGGSYSPGGVKAADAPKHWPFGTEAPAPADPPAEAPPPAPAADTSELSPLDYLLSVVRDEEADPRNRIAAANMAAPYCHAKKGDAGKKAAANEKAKEVHKRFQPSAPPKLVAAGGQKV